MARESSHHLVLVSACLQLRDISLVIRSETVRYRLRVTVFLV